MLHTPHNEFTKFIRNYDRPFGSSGVSITPGTGNVMGSWVDLFGSALSDDIYGLFIHISDGNPGGGVARPLLSDIGVDYSGGSSYSVLIPQLVSTGMDFTGGVQVRIATYYFPIFVPAGARIAARGQTSVNSSVYTFRLIAPQRPTRPDLIRCGTAVEAVGINASASRGTVFTPGSSESEGAWQSLGTLNHDGWFTQVGYGVDDSAMGNGLMRLDFAVGDATSKRLIARNMGCGHSSSEGVVMDPYPEPAFHANLPSGAELFVRGMHQFTPDSNNYAAAYVVRGG